MGNSNNSNNPQNLAKWLASQPEDDFPHHAGITYPNRLQNVTGYMDSNVHPHVEKGALLNNDGFLNNHGTLHVKTVIQRASLLLSHPQGTYPQLSPYEVYLLLLAINFHDVGNIFGREGHESRHADVMKHLKQLVGSERVEQKAILDIARAHGGKFLGDKDTISTLPADDHILGHDVRYQMLAAILRFSDELADDCHRAHQFAQEIDIIPDGSQVYHAYSKALHSVKVCPQDHIVELRYAFTKEEGVKKFGKSIGKDNLDNPEIEYVFLLDEIFTRTLKMHYENKYCTRFMQGVVRIDAIDVRIDVYGDLTSMMPCIDPIGYRLQESGYPEASDTGIQGMCPQVTLNGISLEQQLTGGTK